MQARMELASTAPVNEASGFLLAGYGAQVRSAHGFISFLDSGAFQNSNACPQKGDGVLPSRPCYIGTSPCRSSA